MSLLEYLKKLPSQFMVFLIGIYQKTLSPDHGWFRARFPHGYCKFYPSCSEYGKKAFKKYGFFKGFYLAFWRVLRCNPWSKEGIDELK